MQSVTRRFIVQSAPLAAVAGSGLLAAACGASQGTGGTQADGGKPSSSSTPVTIYWSAWGGGERVDQYKSQAERFTKANPNIKVEFVAQGSGDYNEQIIAMLASNTQLDAARLDGYFISGYVARKNILALDEIMKGDKTFKKSDYLDGAFMENHQVIDGKTYAMPSGDSPRVLFYNTAVWKSAGAPDPNELESKGQWTWDAYLNGMKQIASKTAGGNKVWPGLTYISGPDLYPWVRMTGGRVLSQDLKSVQIDRPEAISALEWLVDLVQKHKLAPMPADKVGGGDIETGKLASFASGNWEAQGFKLRNFKDFDIAPLPKGPKGRFTLFKPNGLTMPVSVKHKDQTWKLMRYLVDDLEKEYIDSGTFMSFRKDNVDYFLKNFPGPNAKWFVEPFNKKEVIAADVTKHWGDMRKVVDTELGAARDGNKSVKDATTEIKRQVEQLLKQS